MAEVSKVSRFKMSRMSTMFVDDDDIAEIIDFGEVQFEPLFENDDKIRVGVEDLEPFGDYSMQAIETVTDWAADLEPELLSVLESQLLIKQDDQELEAARLALLEEFLKPDSLNVDIIQPTGDFYYVPYENALYVKDLGGKGFDLPMVVGTIGEILEFVGQNHRAKYLDVVRSIMAVETLSFKDFKQDWEAALAEYRKVRESSRSLDIFTKVTQNECIDQDHYGLQYALDGEAAEWVGDQTHLPVSLQVLSQVTPKKEDGHGVIKISNVVKGTIKGASGNDYKALNSLWETVLDGELVRVMVYMDKNISKRFKGYIVSKGRRHNLTMVVDLDPNGIELRGLFEKWTDTVRDANEWRNSFFFNPNNPVPKRRHKESMQESVKFLVPRSLELAVNSKEMFKKRKERPVVVKQKERLFELSNISKDKSSKMKCLSEEWPYCKLLGDYWGPVDYNDIGVGNAKFNFSSLLHWALVKNKTFTFKRGRWFIDDEQMQS
nr:MAG: hypothetical protein [Ips quenya-like virus 1]